jgi:hypothetical protein
LEVDLGELWDGCVDPGRADAGHIEGGEDAFGFAQVVPAYAGNSDDRQTIGSLRQHLMGKIDVAQTLVERGDRFDLGRCA